MKKYESVISLGYFCSVAIELEKMGIRNFSTPFDWLITDWFGIERAFKTKFKDFLNYDNLIQDEEFRGHYKDNNYNFCFFHDFSEYKSLDSQIYTVREKYDRRIKRLFEKITKPTLFIRYINTEKGTNELDYIKNNYESIINMFRKYNTQNDILFIVDEKYKNADIPNLYFVKVENGEKVCRDPIYSNKELYNFLNSIEIKNKEENIVRYKEKNKNKEKFLYKLYKKIEKKIKNLILKKYYHNKTYIHNNE